jgi:hypothetical protein
MTDQVRSRLSDSELIAEVTRLARCERAVTVRLIAHLAELDSRRLYLAAGYSSLFLYCTQALHLSEHGAYHRIESARAARRFPRVLDLLTDGALTLTTAGLIGSHLTAENHETLLAAASNKSKRAVEEALVRYFPRHDVPPSLRKLPVPGGLVSATVDPDDSASAPEPHSPAAPIAARAVPPQAPPPRVVTPLAPDRYAIRFTATAETCEKLRKAQDLLRHSVPNGDTAEIFDRALTALIDDLARKKFAATERPQASRGQAEDSRNVPAAVKRAVWVRDGGRCAFVATGGRRCDERGFLEFHHVVPYGKGGLPTVDRIQLRCRPHNAYEAELDYGPRKPFDGGRTRSGPSSNVPREPP